MLLRNFIFKQAQNVKIYTPSGFETDGEKTYSAPKDTKAVILPAYEEERNETGKTVAGIKFLFLEYVPEGAKIEWEGRIFYSKKIIFLHDFNGFLIGCEVEV